jgi:hypothetical protein
MLLTLHCNGANSTAGVCVFTLAQSYAIRSATLKRVFITSDSSTHTDTAHQNGQDIILYGEFTSGFDNHTTHSTAGSSQANNNTFPLGILKYTDVVYSAYDSGELSYQIAGPGTLSNSIQFEIGEFINDFSADPVVTSFVTSDIDLGSIEGSVVLVIDVDLEGFTTMNEVDVS